MSEYLGSAFASFVGNRKAYPPPSQPLQPHDQQSSSLPFAPLPLPQASQTTPASLPSLTSPSPACSPSEPRPSKRLRYSQGPTVLIPDTLAPVPLISPVSILAPATSTPAAPFNPARSTQLCPRPTHLHSSSHCPLPLSHPLDESPPANSLTKFPAPQPSPVCIPQHSTAPAGAAAAQSLSQHRSLKRSRDAPSAIFTSRSESSLPATPTQHLVKPKSASEPPQKHICNHCESHFHDQDELFEHTKLVHQRPFACKVAGCTACFSKQNHLSRHVRIVHNKERPFACMEPGCGSRFGSKSHLGDHTRAVHMRLRNFKCGICDASWSKRFNLEKHIRIRHYGEKPFKCPTCSLSFGTRSHVTRHELKVHRRTNASPSPSD